jgi:hypothetical protein
MIRQVHRLRLAKFFWLAFFVCSLIATIGRGGLDNGVNGVLRNK